MFDTYLDRDYKYACALCICTYVTSAESTPVDRLLGFFFLWTAVRPVVGEPGVSLSPRSWLAYEHWAILDYHKKYKIFDSLPFARAPLCRNSRGPTKIGLFGTLSKVGMAHGTELHLCIILTVGQLLSDMNDLALQIQRMFIICLSGRELFYPQDQCASASVRAHL